MIIRPFDQQSLEVMALNGPNIQSIAAGVDSTVYRDTQINQALHIYYNTTFERILLYAQCVNAAALSLRETPFEERTTFEGLRYKVEAKVNPVEEVGEKCFRFNGIVRKRPYTLSPYIDELSLSWPEYAKDPLQKSVALCFNPFFYNELSEFIEKQSPVKGVEINPTNVKFNVDRSQQKIFLIITDLAKNIEDVHGI